MDGGTGDSGLEQVIERLDHIVFLLQAICYKQATTPLDFGPFLTQELYGKWEKQLNDLKEKAIA